MPSSSGLAKGSHANEVMHGDVVALVALGKPNIQNERLYLMLSRRGVSTRSVVPGGDWGAEPYIKTTSGRSRSPGRMCCSADMTCNSAT